MRSWTRAGKSAGSQAPQAQATRAASRGRPSPGPTAAPSGRAAASTSRAPRAAASRASAWVASRARRTPASGSSSAKARSSVATLGKRAVGSTRSQGIPEARSVRSLAASQPSGRRANHTTPACTSSAGSSSRHRASARRASSACHSSSPCAHRIRRDSPPEPARTWPGAIRSTSVTSQPVIAQRRASEAPNTPAPTTIMDLTAIARYRGRLDAVRWPQMAATSATTATICSLLDGRPAEGAPDGVMARPNPADTADVVAEVALGDAATFAEACRRARAAQRAWASTPAPIRGRAIQQAGRLVEDNKHALAGIVTREVGKPYAEALGEVQEVIDTCAFFLSEGRRLYGQTVPSEMPDKQLFTFRTPVGVAAIITAGNFPVAVPSWYLVPALLCGNAVVWKPSEEAAACAEALTQLLLHAGLPEGVLQLVLATGGEAFAGLERALDERLVDKVGFTGSTAVGARIGELCGRHLQSPCLELGGKNPLVVLPDADLDLAVEGALFSGFGTAGQRCTSLGTVVVHRSVHDEFLRRFDAAVRGAAVGDPTTDGLYGPVVNQRVLDGFLGPPELVRPPPTVHGSTGTGRIPADNPREGFRGDPGAGLFAHPTIVDGVRADDEIYRTETFGPVVGVAVFDDFDEAVELANGHGYGLSAAIYTSTPAHAFRFRERCRAGMISVNNSTSGAEAHLPFGGNGRSGNGSRQSGIWVLDQFTRWQSMNWDYAGTLQKAQMDTAVLPADPGFRL